MTRFALSANETAAALPHVPYVLLAEFDFASSFVRVNSADREYTHNGNLFLPLGTLAGIGAVKENGNLSPEKLDFQLSGVDNSLLAVTLTEDYHGRDVRLWVAYLTEAGAFVTTPQILWEGYMDTMPIHTEEGESQIGLVCENRLIRWNDATDWLYTFEHHRLFDATDNFFDRVATLPNKVAEWGKHPVLVGGPGGGHRDRRENRR